MALLVLAVGCGGGGPRASSTEAPATSDVKAVGDVTVAGRVDEVLHPRLFSIDDRTGGLILVVLEEGATSVTTGQQVQVSGRVVPLDPTQLATNFGIQFPVEHVAGFVGVPCLLASAAPIPVEAVDRLPPPTS